MALSKHLERFAEGTSMHGFRNVVLSKKPQKRIAWFIVFLCAWSLFAYQLTNVVTRYLQFPKKTVTEVVSGGVPFPAITLCNMKGLDSGAVGKIMKNIRGILTHDIPIDNDSLVQEISSYFEHLGLNGNDEDVHRGYHKLTSRSSIAANLKYDTLKKNVISQGQFIVDCSFGSEACKFSHHFDPYYFSCYKFETQDARTYPRKSKEYESSLSEGIDSGFSVMVFTGMKRTDSSNSSLDLDKLAYSRGLPGVLETNSPLSGSTGVRIVIHPPGTEPFPLSEGYDVPPGRTASLAISPLRRKRLGRPYGRCTNESREKLNFGVFGTNIAGKNNVYSKLMCERQCMQRKVMSKCQCVDEMLPPLSNVRCFENNTCIIEPKNRGTKNTYLLWLHQCRGISMDDCIDIGNNSFDCRATNLTGIVLGRISCAENVTKQYMTNVTLLSSCKCGPPCNEFLYDVDYSLSQWPPPGFRGKLWYDDLRKRTKFLSKFSGSIDRYFSRYFETAIQDFVRINVYVKDSTVLLTEEKEEITFAQLLSEIGGQLGLWIGVSVITISEVLEMLLTLLTDCGRRLCGKGKHTSESNCNGGPEVV